MTGCDGLLEEESTDVGTVSGRIVDDEGRGLANATARTDDGESDKTDEGGYFTIEDVRVGNRTVSASLASYFDAGEGKGQANVVTERNSDVGALTLVPLDDVKFVRIRNLDRTNTENWWDGPQRDQFQIAGALFLDDLKARTYGDQLGLMRYNIGRKYKRFTATMGVFDSNPSNTDQVIFIVKGDNTELFRSDSVHLGQPVDVDLDVSTVLTLDILCTIDNTTTENNVWVGFGDAKLEIK